MRRLHVVVLSAAATSVLATPGLAAAQTPTPVPAPAAPPAPASVPAVPATPAPVPTVGKLSLRTGGAGSRRTALAGDRLSVRGSLQPYVAGQRVRVRFTLGGKRAKVRTLTVRRGKGGTGTFALSFTPRGEGTVGVSATHAATDALAAVTAKGARVAVLPRTVGPGSGSGSVRTLQARLRGLGYVVGARGHFDARTARAVLALRKVLGQSRTTTAGEGTMRALAAGRGGYPVRFRSHGRHVEADLSLQVIALVGTGGRVERIYPTSSGKTTTPTVRGSFRFYRKDAGTNALGMVDAAYFIRGYAIHGYHDVPTYNASHGCLRVPVPDARAIFDWVRLGEQIDVYG